MFLLSTAVMISGAVSSGVTIVTPIDPGNRAITLRKALEFERHNQIVPTLCGNPQIVDACGSQDRKGKHHSCPLLKTNP